MHPIKEIIHGYPTAKRRGQVSPNRRLTDGYAVRLRLGAEGREEWFFFDSIEQATVLHTVARQSCYGCKGGDVYPAVMEFKHLGGLRVEIRLYLIPDGEIPDWWNLGLYAQRLADGLRRNSKWWYGPRTKHPRE